MAPATWVVATTIKRREDVGQDVPANDGGIAGTQGLCGADVVLGGFDQGRGAGGAGEIGPFGKADDQHQQRHGEAPQCFAAKAGAHQRQRDDGEDQRRERELNVGDPGDQPIHPPPDIAADKPKGDADRGLDRHREHPDGQGDARAVKDGAQEIAALRVGAEEEARVAAIDKERRKVCVEHVEARKIEGVLRGDERGCECGERDQRKHRRRDQASRLAEDEGPRRGKRGACPLPAHCRASRLMRGSSQRLTMSASVLVTTKRRPTATR